MHCIRMLTLFACCLMSGTLGTGLIILDMHSGEIRIPELDRTWVGITLMLFFSMFIIELVINVNNSSEAYNRKGQKNEENS